MKQEGWACPKCEKVYAPFVSECSRCNNVQVGLGVVCASPTPAECTCNRKVGNHGEMSTRCEIHPEVLHD